MPSELGRSEAFKAYLEREGEPNSVVRCIGEVVYVSVMPSVAAQARGDASFEDQTVMVLEQVKRCLEEAGSSLEQVLACSIHCTSAEVFPAVGAICNECFPANLPGLFVVSDAPSLFDIEVECVALHEQ